MRRLFASRRRLFAVGAVAAVAVVVASGYGYAAVTAENQAYTGCLQNGDLTSIAIGSTPLRPCPKTATQISWSQTGPPGTNGTNGTNGVSVTSASEPAGANCAAGGSKFTAANGVTYACNGAKGDKGDPGPPGPSEAYANYGDGVHTIGDGLTQTVASVTVPAGSYVLSATVAAGGLDGFPEQLQCSFTGGTVHGVVALVQSNGRSAVIGDTTVSGTANPIFLRCFMQGGTAQASGELIAIHVGTVTQSQ